MALCEKQSNKVAGKALCKCAAGSHNVCDAPLCGCMSKHFTRSFVAQRFKSAFHVFTNFLVKTFHFCAEDMLAYCSLLSAQKFHVLCKGARFRTWLIVPLRRTSGCSVTLPGQALLRVRGRAMNLRAGLDGKDAGNTCRIIKSLPCKDVRKGALSSVPA